MPVSSTLATHYNALVSGCPFHRAVLASVLGISASIYLLSSRPAPPRSLPSPQSSSASPYPPDILPGGRWISTPHGRIRAYESGPPSGRKVLLLHGITTPAGASFHRLFHDLVSNNCHVLTFDLFARGYSDAPTGVAYDERLFISQMLYAIFTSEVGWEKFTLIGLSLGGGIAVEFARCFPERLEALVLLVPAGVLEKATLPLFTRWARRGWVPEAVSTWMARRNTTRLRPGVGAKVDINAIVRWQAQSHPGFLQGFISTFRHGPIYEREQEWREVGEMGIVPRIGVLVAEEDDVVDPALLEKMVELLGAGGGRASGRVMAGVGHDLGLATERSREVARFCLDVVEGVAAFPVGTYGF